EKTVSRRTENGSLTGSENGPENTTKTGLENGTGTTTETGTENAAESGPENITKTGTANGIERITENGTKNGKISVRVDRPRPHAVRFLDLVGTYAEEQLEGMMPEKGEHDHAADEEEEEPDEHVWTSPANCAVLIEKLTEEFCALDPQNADQYRANGQAYRAEFEALDEEYRQMVLTAARKTIIFGDRFPFRYLAEEYGLTCYAAFSGCSAESEPSAATIAFLIEKTVEEEVPVVFTIEFSNGNIARAVSEAAQARLSKRRKEGDAGTGQGSAAEATEVKKGNNTETGEEKAGEDAETGKGNHTEAGEEMGAEPEAADAVSVGTGESGTGQTAQIRVLRLHSCHNLTRDEFAAGETCLSLMKQNLEALRTALN
ncbi:MAG: metal ABC transporter substrate-binding protein, partial [Eubacteriales bacterium]|nr:metal ABC transporter substrate-binding protein [Eubacteriales bacterium]